MSSISPDDIRWNDEARTKILEDSDRVLREAVLDVATTHSAGSWEDAFAELNARLKDQFIDFEPGPDLRRYAEAIVGGDIEGVDGGSGSETDSAASSDSDSSSDSASSSASSTTTGGAATPATRAESTPAETADATGGGAYADAPADQIAADSGAAEPATPETDGSGDASDDPASGGASDGTEAPNETIDDPSDPTVTDEPGA